MRDRGVRKAASILDGIDPTWFERVDVAAIEMDDCEMCVLGQAFGGSWGETMDKYDLWDRAPGVFSWDGYRDDWVREILSRRAPKPPAPSGLLGRMVAGFRGVLGR